MVPHSYWNLQLTRIRHGNVANQQPKSIYDSKQALDNLAYYFLCELSKPWPFLSLTQVLMPSKGFKILQLIVILSC